MAEFAYDAINAQGMLTSGVISAPDVGSAREQLQARGLLPSSLAEKAAAGEESFGSMFKKVKPKSLQIFARQLATMIEAGVSVVAALVTLEEQTDDKYLKEVVSEVRGDVESGMIFSRALARHPKVFRPALRRDGRGGRVVGNAGHRPRPRRDADREGNEAQAPREGRDDLPDRRDLVRVARPHLHADVHRPGVPEGVRRAERTAADADEDHHRACRMRCAATGSSSSR